jgi:hypothetical protein
MLWTMQMKIISLVLNLNYPPTTSHSCQHISKIEYTFNFNLWPQNSQDLFGKKDNI